ncbi:hypothetical protein C488_09906 [Natrinema pellirubrum DSM 15624]|uniref:Uncharacterized protein n=1 Tax=Natrinema pellirubrum (strain DSM 15624 / CIP 106293 / JCM 10476 / NCIMB 786 / 157) TaxID=797303 RepID=L0JNY5_NATP1|nr:hypothetical protein [Natrinema pellirubrum]AGB32954.1 hypothetical protein Natpe_3163 [Natrinema pellirubrum DSM 15624]ELY75059.1 hypothetical protein C488_09906 [Natrinema pellirubrum DSM 15624]
MSFAVSHAGTTHLTLHGGSDTTACNEAEAELAEALEALVAAGRLTDWEIADADVYEHPTAPFDPYTIALEFAVTVTVDADDADAAAEEGMAAIEAALAGTDAEPNDDASSPTVEPI